MFYGDFRSEHGERETGKLKKKKMPVTRKIEIVMVHANFNKWSEKSMAAVQVHVLCMGVSLL